MADTHITGTIGAPGAVVDLCWCESPLRTTRYRTRSFRLLRCPSCGSYRIDPPPITREDESSAFYTAYYGGLPEDAGGGIEQPGRHSRFWRVVKQVPALECPQGRIIDFGSGEGRLCHELAAAGWSEVFGVEVSRARAARARARYPEITFFDRPLGETPLEHEAAEGGWLQRAGSRHLS